MKIRYWIIPVIMLSGMLTFSGSYAQTDAAPVKEAAEPQTEAAQAEGAGGSAFPCPYMQQTSSTDADQQAGGVNTVRPCGRKAGRCGGGRGRGYGYSKGCFKGIGSGSGCRNRYGCRGRGGFGCAKTALDKPLTEEDARTMVEGFISYTRNPNLKLGKIEDRGDVFEAEIVTKEGSLVDKMAVHKKMGWIRSIY